MSLYNLLTQEKHYQRMELVNTIFCYKLFVQTYSLFKFLCVAVICCYAVRNCFKAVLSQVFRFLEIKVKKFRFQVYDQKLHYILNTIYLSIVTDMKFKVKTRSFRRKVIRIKLCVSKTMIVYHLKNCLRI